MPGRHRPSRRKTSRESPPRNLPQDAPRRWYETEARWRSRALREYGLSLLRDRTARSRYDRNWVTRNRIAFVSGLVLVAGSVTSVILFDISGGRSLYLRIAVGTVGGVLGALVYLLRRYQPPPCPGETDKPSPDRRGRPGDEGQRRS